MKSEWGSIAKRGNAWRIRWSKGIDPETGKYIYGSKTVHGTKQEARLELDKIHANMRTITTTLDWFWHQYYVPEIEEHLAPSTIHGYKQVYTNHIAPVFGSRELESIKGTEIQAWIDGLSYGTARHSKTLFSAIMGRAHALDFVSDNVLKRRYRLPKKRIMNVNTAIADYETLTRIAEAAQGQPWESAFLAAAFAGCRRAEAFGLTPDDVIPVDMEDGQYAVLRIDKGVQCISYQVIQTAVKTPDSNRYTVVVPPHATRLIELAETSKINGWQWVCSEHMPNPDSMVSAYKKWFASQPFIFIPFKNLRNSYTTNMHTQGMELENIAKLLGHTTDTITYKHYDRPDVKDLVERVHKALN